MAKSFTITAAKEKASLDASRKGEAAFTVTTTEARPMRGELKVKPLGATKAAWLSLADEAVRDFNPPKTQPATVKIAIPADAAAGTYSFRLDAVSVAEPDDDFTEGPAVAVEVAAAQPVPPKKFPWWIIAVVVVVLLGLGGVAAWLMNRGVEVPDVVAANVSYDKAKEMFTGKELNLLPAKDEPSDKPQGIVIRQDPAPGKVKKNTDVQLFVAKKQVVTAGVPNVAGLPEDKARQELTAKGFKTINVSHQAKLPSDFAPGSVAGQTPPAGTPANPETQAIALVIADRGVRVPRVAGRSQADAARVLAGSKLFAPSIDGDGSNGNPINKPPNNPNANVTGTRPSEGTIVAEGSNVTVLIPGRANVILPWVLGERVKIEASKNLKLFGKGGG